MRYLLSLLLLNCWVLAQLNAQFYEPVLDGITGQELLDELRMQYRPTAVLPYDQARDTLFGVIDKQGDSLECIYTGHRVYMPANQDPTTAAYQNGSNDGINTEHTYPQGLWVGGNTPKADMHHLFPTRSIVNNDRASDPFADINDNFVDKWYYRNFSYNNMPTGDLDKYSEAVNGFFEPRESVKGDIARAMMYFYTMYPAEANAEDANYFNNQLSTLCEWHDADPVDWKEWNRTWAIAQRQQGKPNPYVLDCTLAGRGYCGQLGPNCQFSPTEEVAEDIPQVGLSPNPTVEKLVFDSDWQSNDGIQIHLYDLAGHLLSEQMTTQLSGFQIDLSHLPKGMIILQIQGKHKGEYKQILQKVVHIGQ